ncbi:MAG: hypothetical protein IPK34_09560 [Ramlibacter sp.]|nr:hypothetical protein [Ramlibacter sp.]
MAPRWAQVLARLIMPFSRMPEGAGDCGGGGGAGARAWRETPDEVIERHGRLDQERAAINHQDDLCRRCMPAALPSSEPMT